MIAEGINILFKALMAYWLCLFAGWFSSVMIGGIVLWALFN